MKSYIDAKHAYNLMVMASKEVNMKTDKQSMKTKKYDLERHKAEEKYYNAIETFFEKHNALIIMMENNEYKSDPKLKKYRNGDNYFWLRIWNKGICNEKCPLFQFLYRNLTEYPEYPADHLLHYMYHIRNNESVIYQKFKDSQCNYMKTINKYMRD